ncbi:MAG: aldo/keto reductase [Clostridium beijerinckii]|uniref:aldo/keto reductase n=1 Tax=Clostridium beijerinckii TaxID=1520 RepID=UPI00242FE458|nr:aldo/keto reductase [Clostridium beijerinckii]MCI1478723.1 aldo/keto reductase [Clostridium beijerinckii]MCI1579912.1 aldo/keto reductase [Clostridium beijerinckii]MCI1582172.1 aldo/keto reductase [Clostridium beijerinckii]MCI1622689.1 aldo/keto reductase [Clostridium beijerinckii]MDG5853877.1 aldo/keto reductase [Clostridium beijerinckii]
MLYRGFGKTNEKVSVLGFGCMRLPIIDGDTTKIDEEKATKMIRHAINEGVNYIDTAYPYHGTGMGNGGESEPFVGRALKGGYREKVNLATKLPSWAIKTREDMDKYLNEQLERLQIDRIDFYLVHALNKGSWENLKKLGIDEFLNSAIKDGRIRYAGFSFHDKLEVFKEIVDYYDWSFCQIQYNYLDEEFQAGTEGLKYAADRGLGVVIMEPLRGGKIVRNLPDVVTDTFDKAEIKRSPAEWALRWVWNHPEVSVVLSGMNVMDNVTENIRVAGEALPNSLTEKELEIMDNVKKAFKERIKVNCTACEYCMPCPAGVNIPKNFTLYNEYNIFVTPATEKELKERYNGVASSERADKCVECGKCESHCPQAIKIRQELKNVKTIFA